MIARFLTSALVSVSVFLMACASPKEVPVSQHPDWLSVLIAQYEGRPLATPPLTITRHKYRGQVVYRVSAQCCDAPGALYDAHGRYLCAPDGGFLGIGDGRCIDFRDAQAGELLIWQDPR